MSGLLNNFSREVNESIKYSRTIALQYRCSSVTSTHIFLGMLVARGNFVPELLLAIGFDVTELYDKITDTLVPEDAEVITDEILFTPSLKKIIMNAGKEMEFYKSESIDTIHMLLGILREEDAEITQILKDCGITYKEIKTKMNEFGERGSQHMDKIKSILDVICSIGMGHPDMNGSPTPPTREEGKGGRVRSDNKKSKTPALDEYGRDLTVIAMSGKIDPVIGRDDEIKRVWQILARRKKRNVILTGDSGCGKTAIAEGVALCIANKNVPDKLKNKRIIVLDVSSMVAGSMYRGDFEKKMKNVVNECIQDKNIILFIDEIHTIIGSGNSEGAMDGSNILKPYLSSGELQVIGATTSEEYQKYFEKDPALVRRFQKLHIESPDKKTTIAILNGLKPSYESYHGVKYSNKVVELIVELSDKYIVDQAEPDKSINTLDEVGSKLALTIKKDEKTVGIIDALEKAKNVAVTKQNFEEAAILKGKIDELNVKCMEKALNVTETDVREVFSLLSGVPVESVQSSSGEAKRYLSMASDLNKIVINQENAIETIANAIKLKKSGIEDTNKPTVLFFAGPTGSGKTFLAKETTKFLFHDEKKMVFLNGAEYSNPTSVNRLTTSDPGYIGYGEPSDFEPIRNNPYSILLIDECEKMHNSIWQIFLRIFEEGELKTSNGKLINFKNCIIILTSNLGSRKASTKNIGFKNKKADEASNKRKNDYDNAIREYFKPEVYNRLSNIVVFNDLTKEDLKIIVVNELKPLTKKLKEKNIKLVVHKKVYDFLLNNSDDENLEMGARPIKRSIEKHLNNKLSNIILEKGDGIKSITISLKDGELTFTSK